MSLSTAPTSPWHAHGWNNRLSWELLLRITPHLPGFAVAALRVFFAALSLVCMPRERAAVQRNLMHVLGLTRPAGLRSAYRTFFNYSGVMVGYTLMRDPDRTGLRERFLGVAEARAALGRQLEGGRGVIIGTMHLGHWDMGLKMLAQGEVPVHVVMRRMEPADVAHYAEQARSAPGMIIHEAGSSSLLAVELMAALRRGEIVTMQMDRAVGDHGIATPFFGAQARLPSGPVRLAMATGAPLLPVFVLQEGGRYRVMALPALRFDAPQGGPALAEGMRRMAAAMETVVAANPHQWFNFFDVWERHA